MTPPVHSNERLARFSDALVLEIKAELGRQGLSMRALAELIGENHQYVNSRIGAGNPRTKVRVAISVADLAAIASALDVDPLDFFNRALAASSPTSTLPAFDDEVPFDENDSRMAARDLDQPSEGAADRDRQDVDAEAADSDGPEHGA